MSSIDTVVVGSDATSRSLAALRYAHALSERMKRPLTAVHAYLYPPDHYFLPDMMFGNFRLEDSTVGDDALRALEGQVQSAGLEGVRLSVSPGAAHEALVDAAGKCGLIVVGHEHRSRTARLLAGSVATRVVRKATGPVIVIPPQCANGLPKKILVADDFSEPAGNIVPTLANLGLLNAAERHVAYVLEQAMEPIMHAIENVEEKLPQRWEAMERGFGQMLRERYAAPPAEVAGRCTTSVLRGALSAETILEYADAEGFDLVAVAARGKGATERMLLGSTTEALLHQSSVPVLVSHGVQ